MKGGRDGNVAQRWAERRGATDARGGTHALSPASPQVVPTCHTRAPATHEVCLGHASRHARRIWIHTRGTHTQRARGTHPIVRIDAMNSSLSSVPLLSASHLRMMSTTRTFCGVECATNGEVVTGLGLCGRKCGVGVQSETGPGEPAGQRYHPGLGLMPPGWYRGPSSGGTLCCCICARQGAQ